MAVRTIRELQNEESRIDKELVRQYNQEVTYWREVLQRLVEVIKFLAERGLSFFGDNEKIGSPSNGNYLGLLELLAKFDPFLAQHMGKQQVMQQDGKGKRCVSYLSSTICSELIQIMGEKLLDEIINEIKAAKLDSLFIDSTPDVSKVDRLTCIFRYIPVYQTEPVERFC